MTTATLIGGALGGLQKFKPELFTKTDISRVADTIDDPLLRFMNIGQMHNGLSIDIDVTKLAWGSFNIGTIIQGVTWIAAAPAICSMLK